ncbi:hypothetical protein Tco_1035194 [Tanacetum coccineum]
MVSGHIDMQLEAKSIRFLWILTMSWEDRSLITGVIHLSRNHVFHERTKHMNVRYHFIKEVLEAKTVKVLKVGTEHNAVDALRKVVPGLKLQHCLELLSVGVG